MDKEDKSKNSEIDNKEHLENENRELKNEIIKLTVLISRR